jgi:ribosomal protein L3 glutamine methyltransferase
MNEVGVAFGQSAPNARAEAVAIISWALHLPPDEFDDWIDCRLSPSERKAIIGLVEARCNDRVPAAYLTGEAWLAGLCFRSDPRALIPRSLIAEALDSSFAEWLEEHPPVRGDWPRSVLDLCTGGGSLAILATLAFPQAHVTATDLSAEALALAAENCALHDVSDRVRLRQGDAWDPLAGEKFDLILSNPPYVNDSSMDALPREFQAEPSLALAGGPDGMNLIRTILTGAARHLNEGGVLVLELGHEADHFERAFPGLQHLWLPVSAGERMIAMIQARDLQRGLGRPR